MDILYATTFKNEQGNSPPTRGVTITGNGLTSVTNTINASGYAISATYAEGSNWSIQFPHVNITKEYEYYAATITPVTAIAPSGFDISIFGNVVIEAGSVGTAVRYLVIKRPQDALVYINDRYSHTIDRALVAPEISISRIIAGSATQHIRMTDIVIAQHYAFHLIKPSFINQTLTLISDTGWTFSEGATITSLAKTSATDTSSRVMASVDGSVLEASVDNSELPLLIEVAGKADYDPELYTLDVQGSSDYQEVGQLPTEQTAMPGTILAPTGTIRMRKRNV